MTTSSSFSGLTLSSIRTGRNAGRTESLASVPGAAGTGLFMVAPSSQVTGRTRFTSAVTHPYFGGTTETHSGETAKREEEDEAAVRPVKLATEPAEVHGSGPAPDRSSRGGKRGPMTQKRTLTQRPSESLSSSQTPRAVSATAADGSARRGTSTYEVALSSFQRAIIADARAQKRASLDKKASALAKRAALMETYSRKPRASCAVRAADCPSSRVASKEPARPAWLGSGTAPTQMPPPPPRDLDRGHVQAGSAAAAVQPRVSQSACGTTQLPQTAQPTPRPAVVEVELSAQVASEVDNTMARPADHDEDRHVGLSPTAQCRRRRRHSPRGDLSFAVPGPLPRAPATSATHQKEEHSRHNCDAASPAPTLSSSHAATSSAIERIARGQGGDVQCLRHPALHESIALLREVEATYPLLRRLLTPPKRLSVSAHGQNVEADMRAAPRHAFPGVAEVFPPEVTGLHERVSSSSSSFFPTRTTAIGHHHHHRDACAEASTTSLPEAHIVEPDETDETDETERPWLSGLPRAVRPLLVRTTQPRPVPLYQWSCEEAEAAACMQGPFVTPSQHFDRATQRAQWRYRQSASCPSTRTTAAGDAAAHVMRDTNCDGAAVLSAVPLRDAHLRAQLDQYFACAHVLARQHASSPTETGLIMDSSLATSSPPRGQTVGDDVLEDRALEALLSFTSALVTPPKPLPQRPHTITDETHARAVHQADGQSQTSSPRDVLRWLDAVDRSSPILQD